MVVNDNAGSLMLRGALKSIASRLAPTDSASLRFDTFERHVHLNRVGRWAQIFLLAEIGTLEAESTLKACTVAAPWILAFAQESGLDHDWLGHAEDRQVASHVSSVLASGVFASGFDAGGNKSGFAGVQEVFAGDVLVTLGVVGEHAGGIHVELDLAVFRLGSVEAELAVDVLESTGDEAVAQVADLEVNEGVLAFLSTT